MAVPKVTVIIPVYNAEPFLPRCLSSISSQTLRDIEIILVDDGSTDASGGICDEFAARDSRVLVLHQKNAGLGFARNNGLALARGEYVAFVDSDDYVDAAMYDTLYGHAKREGADACISGYRHIFHGELREIRMGEMCGVFRDERAKREIYLNVLGTAPTCGDDFIILWQSVCFSLYSRSLLEALNLRFGSERAFISEDILFNITFFRGAQCVVALQEAYYNYCEENSQSLTSLYREDRFAKATELYEEILRGLPRDGLYPLARQRCQRTYLANARTCIRKICWAYPAYRQARVPLLAMCNTPQLQAVLREYPWKKNPLQSLVFSIGLRYKQAWFLYFLRKIRP